MRMMGRTAGTLAVVYGAIWAVNRSLRRIEGNSMQPLLHADDLVVTIPPTRWTPRRGDVVAATRDGRAITKRVVGLPGERVGMIEGHLYADGVWYREPYVTDRPDDDHHWTLNPSEVLLLGDNRARSTDARSHGPTPLADVAAVVVARVKPWRLLRDRPTALPGPRPRPAARLVVLDPADRVLLFRVTDTDDPARSWWETPGGGIKPRETLMQAATRELHEEVGIDDAEIVDLQVTVERDVAAHGATLRKIEHFLTTRVDAIDVDAIDRARWTAQERAEIAEVRWWTGAELAATTDRCVPNDLDGIVAKATSEV
jgi:signal peptidase I